MNVGNLANVADGGSRDQFGSSVARSAVGVDDRHPFARKALQNAGLNGLHDRADGLRIVVGGQAHQDVHFADVNELAKKIVAKDAFLSQAALHLAWKGERLSS